LAGLPRIKPDSKERDDVIRMAAQHMSGLAQTPSSFLQEFADIKYFLLFSGFSPR